MRSVLLLGTLALLRSLPRDFSLPFSSDSLLFCERNARSNESLLFTAARLPNGENGRAGKLSSWNSKMRITARGGHCQLLGGRGRCRSLGGLTLHFCSALAIAFAGVLFVLQLKTTLVLCSDEDLAVHHLQRSSGARRGRSARFAASSSAT